MSPVITVSRDELDRRRHELLAEVGCSLAEFREFARTKTLTGRESDVLEELNEIAFLLGE